MSPRPNRPIEERMSPDEIADVGGAMLARFEIAARDPKGAWTADRIVEEALLCLFWAAERGGVDMRPRIFEAYHRMAAEDGTVFETDEERLPGADPSEVPLLYPAASWVRPGDLAAPAPGGWAATLAAKGPAATA